MQAVIDQLTNPQAMKLIAQIEEPFKKLPHLPKWLTGFLATVAPYLALIGGILGLIGGASMMMWAFGLGNMAGFYRSYIHVSSAYFVLSGLITLVTSAIALMSFSYLKKRSLTGWTLMFWNSVISIGQNVIALVFGTSGIIGLIIGALISLYVAFEMKREYHN